MMIDGGGEKGLVHFFRRQGQSKDIGVVLDLPVEVGCLIGGVGDLSDSDHCDHHSFASRSTCPVRPRESGDPGPDTRRAMIWVPAFAGTNGWEISRIRI